MIGVHDKNSFKMRFINRILSLELNFHCKIKTAKKSYFWILDLLAIIDYRSLSELFGI